MIRWKWIRIVASLAIAFVLSAYPASIASAAYGAGQTHGVIGGTDVILAAGGHVAHMAKAITGVCQPTVDSAMNDPLSRDCDRCCGDPCAPNVDVIVAAVACSNLRPSRYALPADPAVLDGACLLPNQPPQ